MSTGLSPDTKEYNPGELHAAEQFPSTYVDSGADQAEAFANDQNNSSQSIKNLEKTGNTPSPINYTGNGGGPQIDKPKLQKALLFAKKRGGILGLISLFGVGGAILAGFFGPASMLVNMVENFSISNDTSSTVLERRFVQVFGHMAESDSQTLCAKGSNIACRMGRLSNTSLKQLSKKGVVAYNGKEPIDFSKGKFPENNPSHYEFTSNDGSKKMVAAKDLRGFLANKDNRKYAAKLLGTSGAFNLRVKAWAGKYIQKKFFNKFNLSRKGGLADGETSKFKDAQEKLKATTEKLTSKIPGFDTLKGLDAKIKTKIGGKLEKSKGGGVAYNVASTYCIASKAPAVISAGVAGVQLARLLPIVNELALSPGSKLKASGVDKANSVTGDDMDKIGTLLTNKTKDSDGKMTSALDSPYLLAALGVNKNKPPVSAKYAPGYSVLMDPTMKALRDEGKAVAPACNAILTPMAMFTFAIVESAVTKTNPVGAIAGIVGGFVVGAATAPIVDKIVGDVAKDAINKLAESDNLDNLQGRELGDAMGVSAAAFFSAGAMARNIPTLTKKQVAGYKVIQADTEKFQQEMDIASLSPFDTSSRYTLFGSFIYNTQMAMVASGSYDGTLLSTLGSLAQLPQSLLSSNASAATNLSENYCGYASSFDLEAKTDDDTPAVNMAGLPCTGITLEQADMSSQEALTAMTDKGWVDKEKVIPDNATIDELFAQDIIKKDTPLSTYIESCSDAITGDYVLEAAGCTVKSSVTSGQAAPDKDWSTDTYCKNDKGENTCDTPSDTPAQQTDDTRAFAAMSVFLADFQLAQLTNGEDEEETGSSDSSLTTLENSGKINSQGWANPLDSPKTLVTYSGHNGDDIGASIGSKVYSMREGKVVATETQSVAEMQKLAFCPAFASITGPQNNLTIESIVDGKKYTIRYAHLSEFKVKVGDTVKAGDVVALSGNTGCVDTSQGDGAHLHIDINAGEIYPRDILGTSF